MRITVLMMAVTAMAACGDRQAGAKAAAPSAGVWLLGAAPDSDLIRATATETALRARFGAQFVRTDSIYLGEGVSQLGTILFPDDSARRIEIQWADTIGRTKPRALIVSSPRSIWQLYPGVHMGTDLRTIESLNHGAFTLSGFDWDYSGTIVGFDGGALDALWPRDSTLGSLVILRLDRGASVPGDTLESQVVGDRDFRSDHPAMRAINPRVYQIIVRPR